MHIFLTGEKGIGKSTAISRTVALLGVRSGGFLTYFGSDRNAPERSLYLRPAWTPPVYDRAHTAAIVRENRPHPRPAVFESMGVAALAASRPWADFLLMDECGRLETAALGFRAAVLACLDGAIPILGVVKQDWQDSWLVDITGHPSVCVIPVTAENRVELPPRLADLLRPQLGTRRQTEEGSCGSNE